MKKLYNPLPTGGAPLFTETVNTTEVELWAAIEGMLKHLDPTLSYPDTYQAAPTTNYVSTGIIVSGGDVTDNTTDWDLAAGVAYFPVAGRFARFAAEATIDNADYVMITLDSPTTTQKTFFDAANKNYWVEYAASVATLTPPAAEPVVEYVCVRKVEVLENYSRMGHPTFGNMINQLNEMVGPGELTVITPVNGWTSSFPATHAVKMGRLVQIAIFAQSAASATTDVFVNALPSKFQPTLDVVGHAVGQTSGTIYPVIVSGANITIVGGFGQTETSIDGQIDFLDI